MGACAALRLLTNLVRHAPGCAQLAAEHNGFTDEKALLPTALLAAAYLFTAITDNWIGMESGLLRHASGRMYPGGGLRDGRIIRESHLFQVGKSHRRRWSLRPKNKREG